MSEANNTLAEFCVAGCTSSRGARFWEESELLGPVARSDSGVRRYTDAQMDRARIIAAAQFGGFEISVIKEMLEVFATDPSVHDAILNRLADQVRAASRLADGLPKYPGAFLMEYDL